MVGQPLRREAGVEQLAADRHALLGGELRELVQGVGGAGRASRRCAQERQALDTLRPGDGELLRDHAAEADADQTEPVPPDGVDQGDGIGGVVGHRVGRRWDLGAPEAPLIVGDHVESLGEDVDEYDRSWRASTRCRCRRAGGGPAPDRS